MTAAPVLCLFTRAPGLGEVKRRLAADIGDDAALDAHCRLLRHAINQLADIDGVVTELWVAGPVTSVAGLAPPGMTVRAQGEGDLGMRMSDALEDALARSPRAAVVGSDCPGIDGSYVAEAFRALERSDVVLGPAEDGGYGLIGVTGTRAIPLRELFQRIPWGGDRVLEETLERARTCSLEVALLREIWDVDDAADWQRFLDAVAGNP